MLTFFQLIPLSLRDSKMDFAHVVPVTLLKNPAAWLPLSTIPQVDPDVANWRLGFVGPGCSENCTR